MKNRCFALAAFAVLAAARVFAMGSSQGSDGYTLLIVPDRITLYRLALQSLARTEVELRQRVRRTLIHELAHFFGRDEDELADRGWA